MQTFDHREKIINPDMALKLVQSGQRIVVAMAAAEPQLFMKGIGERCRDLKDVHIHCANPSKQYGCFTDAALTGRVSLEVMFLTSAVRNYHGNDMVHYVPQHLSQWAANMFARGEVDIFWGSCTPPDRRGFVSLGPGACYESEVLRKAKKVILEINPALPMTYGATHVPISWVDHFIESNEPLPILQDGKVDETDEKIARNVAELIPDHATVQFGIGGIPNALTNALADKKDLGVHTEMINDAMMKLYEKGVITGRYKSIWPGKMVGAFVYGSRELYDFVNENPIVELQPASVVNDPYRIGRNYKMFSVNTAVELDLTGQICSESIGHRELSGVGGASETHIGAQRSEGGRGIIAIRSTAKNGESKIVFELTPGAKISISRNDVDTVVTEYGVARLRGRSVAQRVKDLIAIAHPSVREELTAQARKVQYL
jgi:acyl-CoA hydrolase